MAAVGITQKAQTEILDSLKKFQNSLKEASKWMDEGVNYAQGIQGSATVSSLKVTVKNLVNAFNQNVQGFYNVWQARLNNKISAYKTQDTTFSNNLTGKKS